MQHDHIHFFYFFNPTHRLRVCVRTEYVLAYCSMPHSFNMICNITSFRKKNVLTFKLTPGVEGVCKDRLYACMVLYAPFPSNLICTMTTFRKKQQQVLTFDPIPGVEGM